MSEFDERQLLDRREMRSAGALLFCAICFISLFGFVADHVVTTYLIGMP